MNKKLYSLFGVFFQKSDMFGTAHDPEIGIRATIEKSMMFFTFNGIVGEDENRNDISGMMKDKFGDSEITDFTIDDSKMSYRKRYTHRSNTIEYVFDKKEGDVWYGTWSGPLVGKGTAKCIVTEIDEKFLKPEIMPITTEEE